METRDRHARNVVDNHIRTIHDLMLRHKISHEDIDDYAEHRYIPKNTRMETIRNERLARHRMLANLEKARKSRKGGTK